MRWPTLFEGLILTLFLEFCLSVGAVFFLGNMMFVSGFFAMTLITATTAVKSGWGNAVAAYEVAELLLFHVLMNVTGRGRYLLGGKSGIGLLDVLRPEWLLASVAPFLLWRTDQLLGGAIWSRLILYRVVLMTVVTYAGSDALEVAHLYAPHVRQDSGLGPVVLQDLHSLRRLFDGHIGSGPQSQTVSGQPR